MRIDILTLFPDVVGDMLNESILGRAQDREIVRIECWQIRDYTRSRQKQVDDYPYGGGFGMVMQADPLYRCWDAVCRDAGEKIHTIYMSPSGKPFTQEDARRLAKMDRFMLVCGHYEGVDQRFLDECVDEELSLGDFVLTGGEIPAMAVADAVCRLVPGVLADESCFTEESHWDGLLEYPQYSRPEEWHGQKVPEVLRGGNQADIDHWRRKQMLLRTMERRPDMFEKFTPSPADKKLLEEIEKDRTRMPLTEEVSCRPMEEADLPAVLEITAQAQTYLRRHRVDQWQDDYPNEAAFRTDMARGEAHVMTYGGRVAGFFALSLRPDPNYADLTDGKWRSDGPYCVLHRNAVATEFRGTGLADRLMEAVEALARAAGFDDIRVDTHRKNKAMRALAEKHGYTYRGNVLVNVGEGHDTRRQAFEKLLR